VTVTYNTVEVVESYNFPYWSTVFYGSDGCSNSTFSKGAFGSQPPSGLQEFYEPVITVEHRSPNPISGRRAGFSPYHMTPHFVTRTTTTRHLLKRANATNGHCNWRQFGHTARVGGTCTKIVDDVWSSGPVAARWNDVTAFDNSTEYVINAFDSVEIDNAISAVQSDVALDALTSYDALTDIAELGQVPGLATSVFQTLCSICRQLRNRVNAADLKTAFNIPIRLLLKHPNRVFRRLGQHWMEYRYGIMPLVYSCRDIMKTLDRGSVVTSRKQKVIVPHSTGITLPNSGTKYRWTEYEGEVRIRGTVFQWYDTTWRSRMATLGMNPLVTLWELMPMSFVFDWFLNVGDYIARKTSQPLSRVTYACISRRSSISKRTWVHFKNEDKTISFIKMYPSPSWVPSGSPPDTPSQTISRPEESQLHVEVVTDEYRRWIFALSDAQLLPRVNLNWKRAVDSTVISVQLLARAVARIKSLRRSGYTE